MNNTTFSKAIRLLCHPLSLAAIGLMLANDLVFKAQWPSWVTGKLSDFAGMVFLPILAAAALAWLVPPRLAGWLSFGLTGLGFALLKTVPAINALVAGVGQALTGLPIQARLDPTDLLALLGLLPAAWLWRRPLAEPAVRLNWRLLALPLAALVTLADAAAPDYGIGCLSVQGSTIVAQAGLLGGTYQSADGGLTWQPSEAQTAGQCNPASSSVQPLTNPVSGAMFRFNPGVGVERSDNGGRFWAVDYTFSPASEAETTYLHMTRLGNLGFAALPYAAVVDAGSGNLVLAMGHDGLLLRTRGGEWRWVSVGPYQHDSLHQAGLSGFLFLLRYQIALAVLAALGWFYTLAARRISGRTTLWVILGWVCVALYSLLLIPEILADSYLGIAAVIGLFFTLTATLVALVTIAFRMKGEFFRLAAARISPMLLIALVCFAPYFLWAGNLLPQYWYALAASTVLTVVLMLVLARTPRPHPVSGPHFDGQPVPPYFGGHEK